MTASASHPSVSPMLVNIMSVLQAGTRLAWPSPMPWPVVPPAARLQIPCATWSPPGTLLSHTPFHAMALLLSSRSPSAIPSWERIVPPKTNAVMSRFMNRALSYMRCFQSHPPPIQATNQRRARRSGVVVEPGLMTLPIHRRMMNEAVPMVSSTKSLRATAYMSTKVVMTTKAGPRSLSLRYMRMRIRRHAATDATVFTCIFSMNRPGCRENVWMRLAFLAKNAAMKKTMRSFVISLGWNPQRFTFASLPSGPVPKR